MKKDSLKQIVDFLQILNEDEKYKGRSEILSLMYIVSNHVQMISTVDKIKLKLASEAEKN